MLRFDKHFLRSSTSDVYCVGKYLVWGPGAKNLPVPRCPSRGRGAAGGAREAPRRASRDARGMGVASSKRAAPPAQGSQVLARRETAIRRDKRGSLHTSSRKPLVKDKLARREGLKVATDARQALVKVPPKVKWRHWAKTFVRQDPRRQIESAMYAGVPLDLVTRWVTGISGETAQAKTLIQHTLRGTRRLSVSVVVLELTRSDPT